MASRSARCGPRSSWVRSRAGSSSERCGSRTVTRFRSMWRSRSLRSVGSRRRFGRYVYAIGGNPEAAALAGINVRRTLMLTFALMGSLAAVSAAVQTARLNAAVTSLGVQNELDVISAAVIGGTSFSGGIGTVPGAILGAVVMQSLRSRMVLLLVDSPTQDIVVGIVLVAAVGLDTVVRRRVT